MRATVMTPAAHLLRVADDSQPRPRQVARDVEALQLIGEISDRAASALAVHGHPAAAGHHSLCRADERRTAWVLAAHAQRATASGIACPMTA